VSRWCLLLVVWVAAGAVAAQVSFHPFSPGTQGSEAENGVFSEDLTGSGRRDLIGLAAGRIAIFRSDPTQPAGFAASPEVLITGPTSYYADAADVLPEKGKEILILTPSGVWAYVQENGRYATRPRPLIQCETILAFNTLRSGIAAQHNPNVQVLPWNFAFDANGDGLDDLLVPHDNGTDVYLQRPRGQLAKPIRLSLYPVIYHFAAPGHRANELRQTTSRSSRIEVVAPALERRDVNGDGRPDLVSGAAWFAQKVDGTFDPVAAEVPFEQRNPPIADVRLVDLRGSGHKDKFVEEDIMDEPLHLLTRVRVFLADKEGNIPSEPTQVVVDQNVLVHTQVPLHDFDGDGALDFAMYKTDITPIDIANWIRQSFGHIEGNLNFYLFDRKEGRYPRRPPYSKSITMRFEIDVMEAMMGLVWERYLSTMMRFEGDYNGDGRPDLLVREETKKICIYFNTGDRRRLFPRDPDVVLADLPKFAGLALDDLNGDGCTDVILYHGNFDHVVALYISKRQ